MPTMWAMEEFLTHRRLALVGVAPEPEGPVRRMLASMRAQGWDVVPVGGPVLADATPDAVPDEERSDEGRSDRAAARRTTEPGGGPPWYARIADVPGHVDGAVLVVRPEHAAEAIRACAEAGIRRVWLHAAGVGDAEHITAVRDLCDRLGLELVLGTCPLLVARLLPDAPRDPDRVPTLVPVGGTSARTTGRWRRQAARRPRQAPGCDLARTDVSWPCGGRSGCRPA